MAEYLLGPQIEDKVEYTLGAPLDETVDGTWLGDVGRAWGKSAGNLVRSGGMALRKVGLDDAGEAWDKVGKETTDYYQGMTPETATALNKKYINEDGTFNNDLTLDDVARKVAIGVVGSAPAQIPMAIVGGTLAKATMKAVPFLAKGMAPVIESRPVQAVLNNPLARKVLDSGPGKFLLGETAGTTAEMAQGAAGFAARGAAFGTAEGVTSGLSNAVETGDEVRKVPLTVYMPKEYREYGFTEGVPEPTAEVIAAAKTAREAAANRAENEVIWKTALVDMAVSIPTGGGAFGELSQLPTGMFGRGIKRGLISSGIRGGMRGGAEETVQEFFQSGGENRVQDIAKINAGVPDAKTSFIGDLNQAIEGAATGGVSGGVMGGAGHVSQHGAFKVLAAADPDLKNEKTRLGMAYEIGNSLPTTEEKANWAANSSTAISLGLPIDLDTELFLTDMNKPKDQSKPPQQDATGTSQSSILNPQPAFQNEAYNDTSDMEAPKGVLESATDQAAPVQPSAPVQEVTEADKADFENAVLWENKLKERGRSAIPEIPGESERDYAWRLLSEYRKALTPTIANDSVVPAVQSDNEQGVTNGIVRQEADGQTETLSPVRGDDVAPDPFEVENFLKGIGIKPVSNTRTEGRAFFKHSKGHVNGNGGFWFGTLTGKETEALKAAATKAGYDVTVKPNTQSKYNIVDGRSQPESVVVPDRFYVEINKKTGAPATTPLDAQAHDAATSPANETPLPTEAQIEAGNYKKGHVNLHGLDISIENPAGSTRSGKSETRRIWSTDLKDHYGYIKGTVGKDKDHIDVFIKPGIDQTTAGDKVFVVDQKEYMGQKFDEHKVMIGFDSLDAARSAYLSNYDYTGRDRISKITEVSVDGFKEWLKDGDTKKPFQAIAAPAPAESTSKSRHAARAALKTDKAFRKLAKDSGDAHPESHVYADFATGYLDFIDGLPPDQDRRPDKNFVDNYPGHGFNPIDAYMNGYLAAKTGQPHNLRTTDSFPLYDDNSPSPTPAPAAEMQPEAKSESQPDKAAAPVRKLTHPTLQRRAIEAGYKLSGLQPGGKYEISKGKKVVATVKGLDGISAWLDKAEEKAANPAPAKPKKPRSGPKSFIGDIRQAGGILSDSINSFLDKNDRKGNKGGDRYLRIVGAKGKGYGMDIMARIMQDHGWQIPLDLKGEPDAQAFADMVRSAINGETHVHPDDVEKMSVIQAKLDEEDQISRLTESELEANSALEDWEKEEYNNIPLSEITADLWDDLPEDARDVVVAAIEAAISEAKAAIREIKNEHNIRDDKSSATGEEIGSGEAIVGPARESTAASTENNQPKPTGEVVSSSGEVQNKLFATPPKFGTKPQPKTVKGDISTSDLLDSFTSTLSVQPDLLSVMPKEQTFVPEVMPTLDDFDKLAAELTGKPEPEPEIIEQENPEKPVDDKAAEIWSKLTENEKAGVRVGMFPSGLMIEAANDGYNGKDLAVALIKQSERKTATPAAKHPPVDTYYNLGTPEHIPHVKQMVLANTGNSGDIYRMAGPARATNRSMVMSIIKGEKTPQAKSGVTAIEAALFDLAGIPEKGFGYSGARTDALKSWLKNEDWQQHLAAVKDSARQAGKLAFERGEGRTPPPDITGAEATLWLKGWDQANIAAPVEGWTDEENAAAGKIVTKAESAKQHAANTYDAGLDAIKAILKNAADPNKLSSGIGVDDKVYQQIKPHLTRMWFEAKAAGSDALAALKEFIQRVISDLGEQIIPYARTFYSEILNDDIIEQTNQEGTDVNVERSSANLERDSQNSETADTVDQRAVSDESGSTDRGVHTGSGPVDGAGYQRGRDPVLPRREALTPGEFGNPEVQGNLDQAESGSGVAGTELNQRSGDFDDRRASSKPVSTEATDRAADRSRTVKARIHAQKSARDIKIIPGDMGNILETLPLLLPGQTDDVKFAEDRFAKTDGYGAMFTNGTGTGKTFSGLGIIKRLERQGKKNVLIVVPQANVLNAWVKSGKHFLLDISTLKDTKDAGKGIVVTTYANFGQNNELVKRQWDLVVFDEAQYLNSNQTGEATNAQDVMRALTLHPRGRFLRAQMLHPELYEKLKNTEGAEHTAAAAIWKQASGAVYADVDTAQGTDRRSRVIFLSATPFAYDKNIEYAEGYLFDYGPEPQGNAYNSGSAHDRFFMQHFGYRMRYNRLTEPDAKVDQGLMQRQFNSHLKQQKVLSGRMLSVDHDYDRKFVLIESAIGRKIDEGLEFLRSSGEEYGALYSRILKRFDYLHRRYLLEAIKAKEVIPIIKDHLALNRKVVVFHDYNQGGGMNPFDVRHLTSSQEIVTTGTYPNQKQIPMGDIARSFLQTELGRELSELPFARYGSALQTLLSAFPDALKVNGTVSKKDNLKAEELFQDHTSGKNLIIVQADKGKEGISLHDTIGDMPRVLINLGLPVKPTQAIQQEGRIFRVGQASNAMFRYLNTGTNWERWAFATTIARRASTAENLAMGEEARMLLDAFIEAYQDSDTYPAGHEGEGTGGVARDRAANAALTEWDRALTFYFGQQKKTSRNKAAEGVDYFPTPEPLAFKMVEWADVLPGERVLEPSAGHGAIARFFPDNAERRAIEPSLELTSRLGLIFDGDIVQSRFEDHNIVNKYDAIVMNPPLGTASKTAFEHIEKAAQHLKDKGRIVALIPSGPSSDKRLDKLLYEEKVTPIEPAGQLRGVDVYVGDTVRYYPEPIEARRLFLAGVKEPYMATITKGGYKSFFIKMANGQQFSVPETLLHSPQPTGKREKKTTSDLTLVADIQLPSVTFERAGTKVNAHIIVLDKNRTDDGSSTRRRDYTAAETINDLFERIRDAELPGRERVSQSNTDVDPITPEAVNTDTGEVKADLSAAPAGLELAQFPHSKTGATMFAVAMKDRLPAEQYAALNSLSKQHGGYYSKFKGNGAVPGFLFKTEEDRQKFLTAALKEFTDQNSVMEKGEIYGILGEGETSYVVNSVRDTGGENDYAAGRAESATGLDGNLDASGVREQLGLFTPATQKPDLDFEKPLKKIVSQSEGKAVRVVSGTFHTPITHIKSNEDAARVAWPIAKRAQETAVFIVTDKKSKILGVVAHTTGSLNQSIVHPRDLSGVILDIPGAANVYFAHNHPTGDPTPSQEDRAISERIAKPLQAAGINIKSSVIVGFSGDWMSFEPQDFFNQESGTINTTEPRSGKLPLYDREIVSIADGERITAPSQFPSIRKELFPGQTGVVLVDGKNRVVGFVPVTPWDMRVLATKSKVSGAGKIMHRIHETNAAGIILSINDVLSDRSGVDNMVNFGEVLGAKVLDAIDMYGVSMVEKGMLPKGGGAFFALSDEGARRNPIPAEIKQVIQSYFNTVQLKKHPDYDAAKAGDTPSAARLVQDMVKPESIDELKKIVRPGDIFVAAHAVEASGKNKIPLAMAHYYAIETGAKVTYGIVQTNEVYHTGAGMMERMLNRPHFAGDVVKGSKYILVDDVTTSGGTFADLADFIVANGGQVVGVVSLTNAMRTDKIIPVKLVIKILERRFGNEIREIFNIEPAALTAAEAGYLIGFKDADTLRNRAVKAGRERSERLLSKGIRTSEAESGVTSFAQSSSLTPHPSTDFKEAQAWVSTLPISKRVKVWQSPADLKAGDPKAYNQIELAKIDPGRIKAMEFNGDIHVITDNITDMQHLKALVIGHELAHAGQSEKIVDLAVDWFRRTTGKTGEHVTSAHAILEQVADRYGYDLTNDKQFRKAVQEATAAIAEQVADGSLKPIGLMTRLFMYLKHWLRQNGLISHVSDSELSLAVAEMLRIGEKRLSVGIDNNVNFALATNYREMRVPVSDELFDLVDAKKGNIFADYIRLQEKHPEYFTTPEDVRLHVEYVLNNPTDVLPATKGEYTLLVRSNGKDRAAVVEFVLRGGKYRVRSAYIMEEGQLDIKKEKALRAVSKPIPDERLKQNINQGGGVSSGTLRVEPLSNDIIHLNGDDVKANFALAPEIKENINRISEASTLDNLKRLINPLDYSRFRETVSDRLPHSATTWLADNVGNPFWMKENNPEAVPFYEEAKDREVTRMDNNVRMFGGLLDKEGNKTGLKGLFDWSDKTTAWGKIRQEMYDGLTDKQKAAYDVIRFEGDAYGKVYGRSAGARFKRKIEKIKRSGAQPSAKQLIWLDQLEKAYKLEKNQYGTLSAALRNPRIKAAGLDAKTFEFYQAAIEAEEKAFEEKLKIAAENMAEAGMTPEDIEGHISEYRSKYEDIEGWVHRDHGDGEYQVRVYNTIDRLNFDVDEVQHEGKDTDRIRLGTFSGVELSRQIEDITEIMGGSFKQLRDGGIVVLMPKGQGQKALAKFYDMELKDKDGNYKYKVLVYNRFVNSKAAARKLAAEVQGNYAAAMPRNYRKGYQYETSWNFSVKLNEEDYQVLKTSDMKLELILRSAIDKSKAKSEISAADAEAVKEQLVRSTAEILLGRGAGLYQIRRAQYLIEGYDTDNSVKKYEDYINGTAGLFSKARYALRQFKNMKDAAPHIRAWATKYVSDSLRNMGRGDMLSGNVRAIVSLWYLGFNTSWMLVNSTQPYVLGQAELSKYTTSPALKIAKAEKDILTGKLTEAEKALFTDMQVRSQDHDSMMAEITGSNEGVGGAFSKGLHAATKVSMALGQKVEVLNRHTMIVAAYRVFKGEKGMDHATALKKALDVNSMVNIDMGRYNLPGWARGPIGRTFYALQTYIQHMLNYMYNRSTSGNRADQKAVLRLLFAMFLTGGLPAGAPGSDELDKLIQKIFGYSPKLALKSWSHKMAKEYDTPGEMLEGFVWHGIPGMLKPFGVGVSLTGATQIRLPIISNWLAGKDMVDSLTGPVGGLYQKGSMSIQAALRGDWGRSVEYILPTAAGNVMSAIRQSTDGVKTAAGKRVEYKGKQLKMEPHEAALKAFGLQPARTADISETRGFEKSTQAEWNDRRKDALDNYRMSRKLKYIQEFNKDLRGSQAQGLVPPIKPETLANVWGKTNMKKNAWERAHGIE